MTSTTKPGLRLFAVRVGDDVGELYYARKYYAKAQRDRLVTEDKSDAHVTLGPDHWRARVQPWG